MPVPGDYDGNGTAEVAVFRPSAGVWFIQSGATTAWGATGDVALPCRRPCSGRWAEGPDSVQAAALSGPTGAPPSACSACADGRMQIGEHGKCLTFSVANSKP